MQPTAGLLEIAVLMDYKVCVEVQKAAKGSTWE
jgi:hypothetical protein